MLTATQLIFLSSGRSLGDPVDGRCAVCGGLLYKPSPLKDFLKPSFMDHDVLRGGDFICCACAYCWTEYNPDVQRLTGKDKRQKFRNYSHFVKSGKWHVLSKANKADMASLLLDGVVPEVGIIAVSGQKHLAIKARSNPPGQARGWVLYEEQQIDFDALHFAYIYELVDRLYQAGYTKQGILTGEYVFYPTSDRKVWLEVEPLLRPWRGDLHVDLAVYLCTKEALDDDEREDDHE